MDGGCLGRVPCFDGGEGPVLGGAGAERLGIRFEVATKVEGTASSLLGDLLSRGLGIGLCGLSFASSPIPIPSTTSLAG